MIGENARSPDPSKELDEHNQFTRTNIQLVVQWFIFFATANYLVFGLFAQKIMDGTLKSALPLYIGAGLFVVVNFVALAFCLEARRWFKSVDKRAAQLRLGAGTIAPSSETLSTNPFPHSDYSRVLAAMAVTVGFMLIGWVCLAVAVGYERNKPAAPGFAPGWYVFHSGETRLSKRT
jgi:hypothetical protein